MTAIGKMNGWKARARRSVASAALVGLEAPTKWMRTRGIKALFAKGKKIRWRP